MPALGASRLNTLTKAQKIKKLHMHYLKEHQDRIHKVGISFILSIIMNELQTFQCEKN